MVRKFGADASADGAAIASVKSSTSGAGAGAAFTSATGGAGRDGGAGATRGGVAGGALAALAGAAAGSGAFGAGLLASSSAMMRRIEARISSIEGSCAFAAWLIAGTPPSHPDPRESFESREATLHQRGVSRRWKTRAGRAVDRPICRPACARRTRRRAPGGNEPEGHNSAPAGPAPAATDGPRRRAACTRQPRGRVARLPARHAH